ncbi:MAG: homoserine dehydrogenase [Erysipelotrichaceae bacterium]|nr:homoserine dehydrogenase [Erysipelotrichaceae bacterium]
MKIAILGYGVVGKGVEIEALENNIEVKYILMREGKELSKKTMTTKIDEILNSDVDCVVECMGGDRPAYDYVLAALKNKKHVVSANKKMLVKHFRELVETAKSEGVSLLFSAACGGGIPWIKELSSIAKADEAYSYEGIMNGTSNYILDKMYKEGTDFAVALKGAQELGYAEADPSDDIDGVDTANKVILSAGVAFNKCFNLEDVFVKGIRYFNLDDLKYVKDNDYRCVLKGKGIKENDKYHLSVMPTFVKRSDIFANINDNYNCFRLMSKNLSNLVFIGQGAGSLPTASNIIRDIKTLDCPMTVELNEDKKPDYEERKAVYYIRGTADKGYITKPISINELRSIIKEDDFVAEVE